MKAFRNMLLIVLVLCASVLMVQQADSNTITVGGIPGIAASAGGYTWTYSASLDNGIVTNAANSPDGIASFFTIYDFDGYTGVHTDPADWLFSSALLGSTPMGEIIADDPSVINLTWTYTGANLTETDGLGNVTVPLGPFSAESLFNLTKLNQYGSRDNFDFGAAGLEPSSSQGPTLTPIAAPAVPEPSTLLLLGLGLFGSALVIRRKQKSA